MTEVLDDDTIPFEYAAAPDLNGKHVFRHAGASADSGDAVAAYLEGKRIKAPAFHAGYVYAYNSEGKVVRTKHALHNVLMRILPQARRWNEQYIGTHSTKSVEVFIKWTFRLLDLQHRPTHRTQENLPLMIATARKLPGMLRRMKSVDFRDVIDTIPSVHRALRAYVRILQKTGLEK